MKKLKLVVSIFCLIAVLGLAMPTTAYADGPQGGSSSTKNPPRPPPPPPPSVPSLIDLLIMWLS